MKSSLKLIVFFALFICPQVQSVELIFGSERKFSNGQPKVFNKPNVKFPDADLTVRIEMIDKELVVYSEDDSILLRHLNGFISTVNFSENFGCFEIREGDAGGSSSVGVLVIVNVEGRIYSKLIDISKMKFEGVESARVTDVVGFRYPLIDVVVGVKKKGRSGGFWNAKLKIGPDVKKSKAR